MKRVTGRELFLRSPFHNEFWRRSGLGTERIATNLIVGDGMFSSLVFQASTRSDEIDEASFERFAILVPHFVRAVFADADAEALLAAGDDNRVVGGVLRLAQPGADTLLRATINACTAGWPLSATSRQVRFARSASGSPLLSAWTSAGCAVGRDHVDPIGVLDGEHRSSRPFDGAPQA